MAVGTTAMKAPERDGLQGTNSAAPLAAYHIGTVGWNTLSS